MRTHLSLIALVVSMAAALPNPAWARSEAGPYHPAALQIRVGPSAQAGWMSGVGGLGGAGARVAVGNGYVSGLAELRLWVGGAPGTFIPEPAIGLGFLPIPGFQVPLSVQFVAGLAPTVHEDGGELVTTPVLTLRPSVGVWFFAPGRHAVTFHVVAGFVGVPAEGVSSPGAWGSFDVLFSLPVGKVEPRSPAM